MTTAGEGTIPMLLPNERPLLMIMDGHAMVHRSWHAIKVRQHLSSSKTGEETTAVYGFTNTFLKAIQEWAPTHCAIAFDLPAPTFRHLQYKDYKAQRPDAPPELRPQIERVKQLMEAFKVPIYEMERYEADDLIGTLCRQAEEQQIETIILTGDTDTFQLVSPWVRVDLFYSIQDRKVYDEKGNSGPLQRAVSRAPARPQGPQGRPIGQHTGCSRSGGQDGRQAVGEVRQLGENIRAHR